MYETEAAVELLIRAFGGRFASTAYPWVGRSAAGSVWLDAEKVTGYSEYLSGGEQRVLAIVQALATAGPLWNLGGILAGVDRDHLALILAALAHAGGSHEHVKVQATDTRMSYVRLPALVSWPADGSVGAVS
jgi:hypothetical protein